MLSLLLILSIIGIIIGCIKDNYNDNCFTLLVISAVLTLLFGSVLITLICTY